MTLRYILQKTTVRIITDKPERYNEIMNNIKEHGVTFHEYEWINANMIPENPVLGCSLSQLDALSNPPDNSYLLILEGDVEINSEFSDSVLELEIDPELIEEVDSIYLGLSSWGFFENAPTKARLHGIHYEPSKFNTEIFIRVLNMLSTHAILYCNKKYIDKIAKNIKNSSIPIYKEPADLSHARSQEVNNCIALKIPLFYQGGIHEYCTKIAFDD